MGEFIIEANKHVHLVTRDSIILNLPELTAVEDRILTVFVVDKSLNKIGKSEKLGVNIQQIVKGKDFPMWEILLPTPEDCIALRDLQNKKNIIRVEYQE